MAKHYWLQLQHGAGPKLKSFSLVFESDHRDIEDLADDLVLRGCVVGRRLELTTDESGEADKIILGRTPFAFGPTGFVAIQPYQRTVREAQP